jgi:hypothetical protein
LLVLLFLAPTTILLRRKNRAKITTTPAIATPAIKPLERLLDLIAVELAWLGALFGALLGELLGA